MSKHKFTAGPWRITSHGTIVSADRQIASVQSGGFIDMHNARLIAATPDILEALIAARQWLNDDKWRNSTLDKHASWEALVRGMDKAIAKALGE
jgi:hypothetical protein